jgi:uncharacterized SAM-binding protein YcdF (DUF218 family)
MGLGGIRNSFLSQFKGFRRPPAANRSAYRMPSWQRMGILLLSLAVVFTGLFFWAGRFLVRDDSAAGKAEVAVIMMGELIPRSDLAESLLKQGIVKKILFFRPIDSALNRAGLTENDGDLTLKYLLSKGVKKTDIEYVSATHNSSTKEEAQALLKWLQQQPAPLKNLAVCTSWYHTSRTAWILEKELTGQSVAIHMHPAFAKESKPNIWWRYEDSFLMVFNEYLKWTYYLIRY